MEITKPKFKIGDVVICKIGNKIYQVKIVGAYLNEEELPGWGKGFKYEWVYDCRFRNSNDSSIRYIQFFESNLIK